MKWYDKPLKVIQGSTLPMTKNEVNSGLSNLILANGGGQDMTIRDLFKDKSEWYRMEEREKTTYPVDKTIPTGSWLDADRVIVRAGYYISPTDMPYDLLREEILERIGKQAKQAEIWLNKGFSATDVIGRTDLIPFFEGTLSKETVLAVLLCTGGQEEIEHLARRHAWEIRRQWMQKQPEYAHIRTFWYVDCPGYMAQYYDIKMKLIGQHYPGGHFASWEGEGDYEPPSLDVVGRQQVYRLNGWAGITRPFDTEGMKDWDVFLHPLDLKSHRDLDKIYLQPK
jgi:hypothetical protein